MRILVNFIHYKYVWRFHCMAEDARTLISPFVPVENLDALRQLLLAAGADEEAMEEFEKNTTEWSHGCVWMDVDAAGAKLLQLSVQP